MIRKIFKWVFSSEIKELNSQIEKLKDLNKKYLSYKKTLDNILENLDISVDVHEYHKYSKSWAVISLQGTKSDYIKFVDLGDSDIREIQKFLKQFERKYNIKVDATPEFSRFIKNM